jgi:hypothetical protein
MVLEHRLGVDDPVDAFAVHGISGAWGVLAVGFFHESKGLFHATTTPAKQLWVQLYGVIAIVSWTVLSQCVFHKLIHVLIGRIRVDVETEQRGFDSETWGDTGDPKFIFTQVSELQVGDERYHGQLLESFLESKCLTSTWKLFEEIESLETYETIEEIQHGKLRLLNMFIRPDAPFSVDLPEWARESALCHKNDDDLVAFQDIKRECFENISLVLDRYFNDSPQATEIRRRLQTRQAKHPGASLCLPRWIFKPFTVWNSCMLSKVTPVNNDKQSKTGDNYIIQVQSRKSNDALSREMRSSVPSRVLFLGSSGSGKTTLINQIHGVSDPLFYENACKNDARGIMKRCRKYARVCIQALIEFTDFAQNSIEHDSMAHDIQVCLKASEEMFTPKVANSIYKLWKSDSIQHSAEKLHHIIGGIVNAEFYLENVKQFADSDCTANTVPHWLDMLMSLESTVESCVYKTLLQIVQDKRNTDDGQRDQYDQYTPCSRVGDDSQHNKNVKYMQNGCNGPRGPRGLRDLPDCCDLENPHNQYVENRQDHKTAKCSLLTDNEENITSFSQGTEPVCKHGWELIDVPGARDKRISWLPYMDNVDGVVFTLSLLCYRGHSNMEYNKIKAYEDAYLIKAIFQKYFCSNSHITLLFTHKDKFLETYDSDLLRTFLQTARVASGDLISPLQGLAALISFFKGKFSCPENVCVYTINCLVQQEITDVWEQIKYQIQKHKNEQLEIKNLQEVFGLNIFRDPFV